MVISLQKYTYIYIYFADTNINFKNDTSIIFLQVVSTVSQNLIIMTYFPDIQIISDFQPRKNRSKPYVTEVIAAYVSLATVPVTHETKSQPGTNQSLMVTMFSWLYI